jgi:uncharacterized membrane protein YciS (DUF1049 family)
MKSYLLGIVAAMILSAAYALSNTAEITVKFLNLQRTFNQGLWEIIVFGCGVLIMWFISVCASIETYIKNRKKTKELTKRVAQLEDERKSLLAALRSFGWKDRGENESPDSPEPDPRREESGGGAETVCEPDFHRAPEHPPEPEEKVVSDKRELSGGTEHPENAEAKSSFLTTLIASVASAFKREKKPETEGGATEPKPLETDAQAPEGENAPSCAIPEFEPDEEGYDARTTMAAETEDEEKSKI